MKALITIILLSAFTQVKAQTNTARIGELEKFRTWVKAEMVWMKREKTKDSLINVNLQSTITAQALTIDSLRKVIPPTYKFFIGDKLELKNDTLNIKQ